ncbi:MAG: BspA family leucine-rich repeat surface protein [Neisseriaceae bacterium]|nr:MAG: BspA family leucine-rich repeat surface protein [Neisseriaceae bacterium]
MLKLNKWSVSNVTSMERLFMMNQSFNQALNNWDTSKVTNMDGMFAYTIFNQDISQWSVGNVSSWNAFNLAGMLAEENTPKFKNKY